MKAPYYLLTVATFENAIDAWIYRNKLATNEIDAFIADEHVINTDWTRSLAVGGVKVQIPNTEIQKFVEYEKQEASNPPIPIPDQSEVDDSDDKFNRCPNCDSIEVSSANWSKRISYLCMLITGCPLPIFTPHSKCNDCGFSICESFDLPKLNLAVLLALPLAVAITVNTAMHHRPRQFCCFEPVPFEVPITQWEYIPPEDVPKSFDPRQRAFGESSL